MSCATLRAELAAGDAGLTPVHHSITSSQAASRAVSSSPAFSEGHLKMNCWGAVHFQPRLVPIKINGRSEQSRTNPHAQSGMLGMHCSFWLLSVLDNSAVKWRTIVPACLLYLAQGAGHTQLVLKQGLQCERLLSPPSPLLCGWGMGTHWHFKV